MTKPDKTSTLFLVDMELMLHDLIVDIMERYGYDLEQAKGLVKGLVSGVFDLACNEIQQEEAAANEND